MVRCVPIMRQTIRLTPLFCRAFSSDYTTSCSVIPTHYEQNDAIKEKRPSRRRYSATNTKGRSKHIDEVIASLKNLPKAQRRAGFDNLPPRDRLDVLRHLHRRRERHSSGLSTFKSHLFERRYFFREADIEEQSTLGRGPGGQATNRRMQTAIVKHAPTGLTVKFSRFPSYWMNRRAAREMLNLQLEEYWCGSESKIGRIKRRRERRRLRRLRTMQRLAEKGGVLRAMLTQQRQFYSVLSGKTPFPPLVSFQLQQDAAAKPLFLKELFDGECSRWWPLLFTAFHRASSSSATPVVPEIFWYIFPAVIFSSPPTAVQTYEWKQLRQCAADDLALCNVKRGFRCFVELFGLYLREASGEKETLSIERDGLNWLEFRNRMIESAEAMTPLAVTCCPHVYRSLLQFNCSQEAGAFLRFFERESKKSLTGTSGTSHWALQGWNALKEVERENEGARSLIKS